MAVIPELRSSGLEVVQGTVEHALVVLLLVVVAYRLTLVRRQGQCLRPERNVITALLALAFGNGVALPEVMALAPRVTQLWCAFVLHVLVLVAMMALAAAFGAGPGPGPGLRRGSLLLCPVVAVLGVIYANVTHPVGMLVYYEALNLVLLTTYAHTARVAATALASAPRQQRAALGTVTWALAGLAVLSATRTAWGIVDFVGFATTTWNAIDQILSRVWVMVLLLGLTGRTLVQSRHEMRSRRIHVRLLDEIEPLWTMLMLRYPHLQLDLGPAGTAQLRLYRRVVECHDGLLLSGLQPLLSPRSPIPDLVVEAEALAELSREVRRGSRLGADHLGVDRVAPDGCAPCA